MHGSLNDPETKRGQCQEGLQQGGVPAKLAAVYCQAAVTAVDFYGIDRSIRVLHAMLEEEVLPHVALSMVRHALDAGPCSPEGADLLDWCEIAIQVCRQKKRSGQSLRNSAGLLVKIIKDLPTRSRVVSPELEASLKQTFRRQQAAAEHQDKEDTERAMILEYEHSRMHLASLLFQDMSEDKKALLRKQKAEILRNQERFQRISPEVQEREIDSAILQDIARKETPRYEKWRLRKQAQQAVLSFAETNSSTIENIA
jgi:hypothetical protein